MSETAEQKAPYDTPDAVISGGITHYGTPLGMGGRTKFQRLVGRARGFLMKLRGKTPRTPSQHFLLRITYRDYQTRVETVHFDEGLIQEFAEKVLAAPAVRSVEVAELLFKGRKSFGSDYDPANLLKGLEALVGKKADGE